jgi:phage-related protein
MAYQRNTNQTFTNETQKLAMDDVVILISIYALDRNGELTNFPTYNLTPSVQEDEIVSFWFTEKSRYLNFSPFPVEVSQVENSAAASLPRPQMTLSNLSSIFDIKPESLVGGRVEIRQTFKKYLWGNELGKSGSCLPVESYVIDRLAGETFETLEEGALSLDRTNYGQAVGTLM